jgi:hypothetical protein
MRNLKMGLITLAASAALLIPAAGASAATQSVSKASTASTASTASSGCLLLCFNTYVDDVLSGNDVSVLDGASFCGISVNVLQVLSIGQIVDCGTDGDGHHKKVKRTK